MNIVLATGNDHKKREIQEFLGDAFHVSTMREEGIYVDIVEDGDTFEENALIKARNLKNLTDKIIMADDSGLEVQALNGRPGVYSSRYAGEGASDEDNNQKLLRELNGVPENKRQGKFVCVIAVVLPDGSEFVFRGECKGVIGYEYRGDNGFGYDPLFVVENMDKSFAQLDSDEKNRISHRGRALYRVKEFFDNLKHKRE